jgi:hypothetical protein
VVLRNGWGAAEARAMSTEKLFKKSEYEYLKIVLQICRNREGVDIGDMTLHDIGIAFTRTRSDAMQSKAQVLQMLLEVGVNPEDAYEACEIFSDSLAVWNKSRQWQENELSKILQQIKTAKEELAKLTAPSDNGQKVDAPGDGEKLGNPEATIAASAAVNA